MVPAVQGQCNEQEMIVEQRRVTYINRASREGSCTELRKVVHAYGAVFYFQDGSSITEWMYQQGMIADINVD